MDDNISAIIQAHGWAVVKVGSDDNQPNYAYSIGLFQTFGHAEVIVFGLAPNVLQGIINVIGEKVRGGDVITTPSISSDVLEGYACAFREVAPAAVRYYMGIGVRYYGGDFPAIHCIWPDRAGRFPWEMGVDDTCRRLQPMLSEGPEPYTHTRP